MTYEEWLRQSTQVTWILLGETQSEGHAVVMIGEYLLAFGAEVTVHDALSRHYHMTYEEWLRQSTQVTVDMTV